MRICGVGSLSSTSAQEDTLKAVPLVTHAYVSHMPHPSPPPTYWDAYEARIAAHSRGPPTQLQPTHTSAMLYFRLFAYLM